MSDHARGASGKFEISDPKFHATRDLLGHRGGLGQIQGAAFTKGWVSETLNVVSHGMGEG
jgi:hypothetical protein